jgi:hypothetical protein
MLTLDGKSYQIISIRRIGSRGFSIVAQRTDGPSWENEPAYRHSFFVSRDQLAIRK